MRVVFAGTPEVALPSLMALRRSRHEVVAVVTRPDAPVGRGRHTEPSPVKQYALERGIPVLAPAHPRDEGFLAELTALAPQACPVVAYGALLPQRALDIPGHGWINLHFSLLPAWRGAAPVQRALMAGDELTGATTFRIVRALDAGPVYGTVTEPIAPRDTAGDLLERLSMSGADLLVRTLDAIEDGTVQPVPQAAEGISHAPKVEVDDGAIRWDLPAHLIDRLIRGVTPAPGAWTAFRADRLRLGPVRPVPAEDLPGGQPLAPGELLATKRAVYVGTGSDAVSLGRVTAKGKKEMSAPDWARGVRIGTGERLSEC